MATKRGTRGTKSTSKSGVKSLKPKTMNSKQANRVKGGGWDVKARTKTIGWDVKANKPS